MLDWYFIIMLILAFFFLVLSIEYEENKKKGKTGNPFWCFMFLILSTSMWFILALLNLNIETPVSGFNVTSGNMEIHYELYTNAPTIYLSYLFMGIGIMCIIYMIVLIFGNYYENLDERERKSWDGTEE